MLYITFFCIQYKTNFIILFSKCNFFLIIMNTISSTTIRVITYNMIGPQLNAIILISPKENRWFFFLFVSWLSFGKSHMDDDDYEKRIPTYILLFLHICAVERYISTYRIYRHVLYRYLPDYTVLLRKKTIKKENNMFWL